MDLATLRSMRKKSVDKITAEMSKMAGGGYSDDRFWKLEGDKAGNGSAIIRFLPGIDEDGVPWVRLFEHMFKGPTGRWYAEKSLTTLKEDDPVSELNSRLWNSGIESDKDIARAQKRQLRYITNILVISDSKNPDNEGKVFLFKFGKKIFDKIKEKATPTFADDEPVDIFNPYTGANFKLRMRKVKDYANFDESIFLDASAIDDNDEAMLEVLNRQYSLTEFVDPKSFKSYEELAKKMNEVLFPAGGATTTTAAALERQRGRQDDDVPEANAATTKAVEKAEMTPPWDDDDDAMAFFKKIAQDE